MILSQNFRKGEGLRVGRNNALGNVMSRTHLSERPYKNAQAEKCNLMHEVCPSAHILNMHTWPNKRSTKVSGMICNRFTPSINGYLQDIHRPLKWLFFNSIFYTLLTMVQSATKILANPFITCIIDMNSHGPALDITHRFQVEATWEQLSDPRAQISNTSVRFENLAPLLICEIFTDHKSLKYLFTQKELNIR